MDYMKLSKNELLQKCEELGITKCKSKNKSELVELILNKMNAEDANEQSVPTTEDIVPEEKSAATETKSKRKTSTKKVKEVVLPKAVEDTFEDPAEESKPAETHASEPVKPKRKPAVKKSEVVPPKTETANEDTAEVSTEAHESEPAKPAKKQSVKKTKPLNKDWDEEDLSVNNENAEEVQPKATVRSRAKPAAKKAEKALPEKIVEEKVDVEEEPAKEETPAPVVEKPKRKPAVKKSKPAETRTIEHTDESSINDDSSSVDVEQVPVKKAVVKKRKEVDIVVNMTPEDFKEYVKEIKPVRLNKLVYNKTYYVDNEGETTEPRNIVFGRFVGLENAEDEDGNSLILAHFKNVHKVMGEYADIGEMEFIVDNEYLAYIV